MLPAAGRRPHAAALSTYAVVPSRSNADINRLARQGPRPRSRCGRPAESSGRERRRILARRPTSARTRRSSVGATRRHPAWPTPRRRCGVDRSPKESGASTMRTAPNLVSSPGRRLVGNSRDADDPPDDRSRCPAGQPRAGCGLRRPRPPRGPRRRIQSPTRCGSRSTSAPPLHRARPGRRRGSPVDDAKVVGCRARIETRELWGLSLLVVDPAAQSAGAGRRLLDAPLTYAEGCDRAVIMSSTDPRAIRSYATSGFALHPQVQAVGKPDRAALPAADRASATARSPTWSSPTTLIAPCAARRVARTMSGWPPTLTLFVVDDADGRGYAYVRDRRRDLLPRRDRRRDRDRAALALLRPCRRDRQAAHGTPT